MVFIFGRLKVHNNEIFLALIFCYLYFIVNFAYILMAQITFDDVTKCNQSPF
jgi:hypothetical protein